MSKIFYYNEGHKYIKRKGNPGNFTYIYKQPKEERWKESNRWLEDLDDSLSKDKKKTFLKLLKDREDKLKGFSGDKDSHKKFISVVRKGLKQFEMV